MAPDHECPRSQAVAHFIKHSAFSLAATSIIEAISVKMRRGFAHKLHGVMFLERLDDMPVLYRK